MLKILKVASASERYDFFKAQTRLEKSAPATWVVSDLKSKFEIQNEILKQKNFFKDEEVLRASELWKKWLMRVQPDYKFISREFLLSLLKERLSKNDFVAAQSAATTVSYFMDLFMPLLGHENGIPSLRAWLQEHPNSVYRWAGWLELAKKEYDFFLSQKMVATHWSSSLLLSQLHLEPQLWDSEFIFDLGSELKRHEVELIWQLSQKSKVTVIEPLLDSQKWQHLLQPYAWLNSKVSEKDIITAADLVSSSQAPQKTSTEKVTDGKIKAAKVTGVLAEVKYATEVARQWVERGVPPAQISIIAADIEGYWPILGAYLEEEGLPANKNKATRLQSFPDMGPWISRLRLVHQISYEDLERSYYGGLKSKLRFEDFHALFAEILDLSDLKRSQEIEKLYYQGKPNQSSYTRDQFLTLALSYWPGSWPSRALGGLEKVVREVLQTPELSLSLSWESWVHWTEQIIARSEINLSSSNPSGIQICDLLSADSWHVTHRIFLGMTETLNKKNPSRLMDTSEIESLARDTGFILDHPEQNSLQFEMQWLLSGADNTTETHLVYPVTSLEGQPEASHLLWLMQSGETTKNHIPLTIPRATRWDYLQHSEPESVLPSERGWSDEKVKTTLKVLDQDRGAQALDAITGYSLQKISPTLVEKYQDCPFVFTAEHIFNLLDRPVMDLDPEARVKGQLLHLILEKVLQDLALYAQGESHLELLIDSLRETAGLKNLDEHFWNILKKRYVKMAQKFIDFEIQWRKNYPQTKTVAVEKKILFQYDEQTQISGKIDRIDSNQKGDLVLIDYKTSDANFNFSSWIKNNKLQLGFYMMAIESNQLDLQGEVVGAVYYSLKNMNRNKGLRRSDVDHQLYDPPARSGVDANQKAAFIEELKQLLDQILWRLRQGEISPKPREKEMCRTCNWRMACRAPHLN